MKALFGLMALALVLAACESQPESVSDVPPTPASAPATGPRPTPAPPTERRLASPPSLEVMAGDEALTLSPYSYCWFTGSEGVCADGAPREPLPSLSLSTDSPLTMVFPLDWEMTATLLPDGEYCNGEKAVAVDPRGSTIDKLGPAGTYRVDVFGRGAGGDGAWAFELVVERASPAPDTYWRALWHPGGRALDREARFQALIGNISTRPSDVSGSVSVEASNGATEEFLLPLGDDADCWASTLGFEGGSDFTERVIELGPPPFSIALTVTIDGQTITGDPLTWPSDFPDNSNESARAPAG